MAKLTLDGDVFNYPGQGSEPGWGDDSEAWATKVTEILTSTSGNGFKNETQVVLTNPVDPTPIPGLSFNNQDTQYAEVVLHICRKTSTSRMIDKAIVKITTPTAGYNTLNIITTTVENIETQGTPLFPALIFLIDGTGQVFMDNNGLAGWEEVYIKYKSIVNIGSRIN